MNKLAIVLGLTVAMGGCAVGAPMTDGLASSIGYHGAPLNSMAMCKAIHDTDEAMIAGKRVGVPYAKARQLVIDGLSEAPGAVEVQRQWLASVDLLYSEDTELYEDVMYRAYLRCLYLADR